MLNNREMRFATVKLPVRDELVIVYDLEPMEAVLLANYINLGLLGATNEHVLVNLYIARFLMCTQNDIIRHNQKIHEAAVIAQVEVEQALAAFEAEKDKAGAKVQMENSLAEAKVAKQEAQEFIDLSRLQIKEAYEYIEEQNEIARDALHHYSLLNHQSEQASLVESDAILPSIAGLFARSPMSSLLIAPPAPSRSPSPFNSEAYQYSSPERTEYDDVSIHSDQGEFPEDDAEYDNDSADRKSYSDESDDVSYAGSSDGESSEYASEEESSASHGSEHEEEENFSYARFVRRGR